LDRKPNAVAGDRARWLAELASALHKAKIVLARLQVADHAEIHTIRTWIDAACAETESLRKGGWIGAPRKTDPFWTQLLPWASGDAPSERGDR